MDETVIIPTERNGILSVLIKYLSSTAPIILIFHLIWFIIVCFILSSTYVVAFHFTNLISLYEQAHNVEKFNTNLVFSAKQDAAVNATLTDLMNSVKANRTYVFRYHNGLSAVSGVPFFFQSNTHEIISPGTPRVVQFEQHIPASINLAISNQFMKNQCAIVPKADEDKDSQNYWFFQNRGAKSLIRCPIFMSNGDLFGFVGADYTERAVASDLILAADRVKIAADSLARVFASKP